MSQISLKSISGITSITTPAGVDNVFTVHSNDTTERFRIDKNGNQNISGVVTATSFHGDGSSLTGIDATTVKDSNGNVRVSGTPTGAVVTGILTTTQFKVTTGANAFETSSNVFKGASGQKGVYLRSALSSATTPSYSSVDDTNTGIFLPGSDVFAVTTGGTERLNIDNIGHVAITTTGALKIPVGNDSQRPSSSVAGDIRYNSSNTTLEFYTGTAWVGTNVAPTLNSVTGDIYNTVTGRTIVINCNDISSSGNDVKYSNNSTGAHIATDTSASTSGNNITSTIPAAVYNTAAGTVIKIEVISGAGIESSNSLTKTILASPSGGTKTSAGGYWYHTFTSSGTFTNTVANLSVEYLVVAGGGGGGGNQGGGAGGAGGYRTGSASLSTGTFSASIGSGGSNGGNANSGHGNDGGNSSFNGLTSTGGGGGVNMRTGGHQGQNGRSGGSGGGASHWLNGNFTGGSGTSGQGNDGGDARDTESLGHNGGGGGGAGGSGSNGQGAYGGTGGNGSTWSNGVTYAGGGGGGCYYNNNSGGSANYSIGGGAGTGGGGRGSRNQGSKLSTNYSAPTTDQNGVDGYGGGGGGGGGNPGDGGDGVVIVRYQL